MVCALHSFQVCPAVLPQPARTACLWITCRHCCFDVLAVSWMLKERHSINEIWTDLKHSEALTHTPSTMSAQAKTSIWSDLLAGNDFPFPMISGLLRKLFGISLDSEKAMQVAVSQNQVVWCPAKISSFPSHVERFHLAPILSGDRWLKQAWGGGTWGFWEAREIHIFLHLKKLFKRVLRQKILPMCVCVCTYIYVYIHVHMYMCVYGCNRGAKDSPKVPGTYMYVFVYIICTVSNINM